MLENISIGIVAGLLTAFITIVLRALWVRILIPWFEELLYKDIKIEGVWIGLYIDNYHLIEQGTIEPGEEDWNKMLETVAEDGYSPSEIRVNLKRNGYRIRGDFLGISGSEKGTIAKLEGEFKNLILSGIYDTKDNQIIDKGSFSFISIKNGTMLKGYFSSYENNSHSIRPFYCLLKKE
ncbi:MAG: hypothetical protein ED557_03705 [Balneola sp.]|nr:MAG: hypothetical protein ED557_03705 [Balneola sp.]